MLISGGAGGLHPTDTTIKAAAINKDEIWVVGIGSRTEYSSVSERVKIER